MEALYHLECRETGQETVPLLDTGEPSKGETKGKKTKHYSVSRHELFITQVVAFCDVDPKKISQGYYTYEESHRVPKPRVPIVHFSMASPPFLLCVKWVSGTVHTR